MSEDRFICHECKLELPLSELACIDIAPPTLDGDGLTVMSGEKSQICLQCDSYRRRIKDVSETKKQEYVEPLEDWLLVHREEEGIPKTKGGIILPDETRARHKPMRGTVLAVGPGKLKADGSGRLPMPVKPEDVILYRQFSGDRVGQYLGLEESVVMMRTEDLLGVIKIKS